MYMYITSAEKGKATQKQSNTTQLAQSIFKLAASGGIQTHNTRNVGT